MSYYTQDELNKIVNLTVDTIKQKATEALSSVLENWVHGGDADCIIAEFEEKLNNV
ncbi:hypothetical protein [Bacteroides eggerthii]|jgi:hypothetical protein|uniref:hypothetical protein n=1 Tax=Bacteroides eggerthii TaxID=28111 RepID=UPI00189D7DB8|nr:hypothetical protein [Bacteroides eggerthii]MDU6396224.1 hypothetical protein [Bacteroides sp.]